MAGKVMAAALQYSKWLSRFICWVWAAYRFSVIILSAIVPTGEKCLYSDKFILKWLDKGGFKSLIGKVFSQANKEEEGDEEDDLDQNG